MEIQLLTGFLDLIVGGIKLIEKKNFLWVTQ